VYFAGGNALTRIGSAADIASVLADCSDVPDDGTQSQSFGAGSLPSIVTAHLVVRSKLVRVRVQTRCVIVGGECVSSTCARCTACYRFCFCIVNENLRHAEASNALIRILYPCNLADCGTTTRLSAFIRRIRHARIDHSILMQETRER
jgi:hypothetical protein